MIRLSLSQRERIKVRDSSGSVLPRQSKSPEGRYQVLREPDDSKNERRQFRFCSEIAPAPDRMLREGDSHDLSHPTRQQVSQPDNKNLLHNDRWDAGVEIYNARNFDFEDGAIECVRSLWRFCGGNEHESRGGRSSIAVFSEKINRSPLTLILSRKRGEVNHICPFAQELDWWTYKIDNAMSDMPSIARRFLIRLSLSQRERIKVRDWFGSAVPKTAEKQIT